MQSFLKYTSKFILVSLLSIISIGTYGQLKKSGEVGITLGGSYYLGELNSTPFVGTKLAVGVLYRHTFDTRFSIKGSFTYGTLSGEKENTIFKTPATIAPIETFKKHFYELGGVAEFNFLPFLPGNKKYISTPYVFAGLATAYYDRAGLPLIISIPFGVGVKYNINSKFILAVHYGMQKTFIDNIDYDYQPQPSETNPIKQWGYAGNKDWYSVFGVSLSYKIKYRLKCPAFD